MNGAEAERMRGRIRHFTGELAIKNNTNEQALEILRVWLQQAS